MSWSICNIKPVWNDHTNYFIAKMQLISVGVQHQTVWSFQVKFYAQLRNVTFQLSLVYHSFNNGSYQWNLYVIVFTAVNSHTRLLLLRVCVSVHVCVYVCVCLAAKVEFWSFFFDQCHRWLAWYVASWMCLRCTNAHIQFPLDLSLQHSLSLSLSLSLSHTHTHTHTHPKDIELIFIQCLSHTWLSAKRCAWKQDKEGRK